MPMTMRSDLVIPEVLADAVRAAWPDRIALQGTPAVVESPTFPGGVKVGNTVRIPYFNAIGEFEILGEGVPLTPVKLTMASETATVQRTGKSVEMSTWAELSALYADPYAELARQIVEGAQRAFDTALVDAASATGPGQVTVDKSTDTITYDAIVDALAAFGDAQVDVAAVVVHSKVKTDLQKLKDNNGLPLFVDVQNGGLPKVLGLPIIVSDRAPVISGTPTKYVSLFVLRGGLALWYNGEPKIETDRDILADSTVMAVNVYYVAHRYRRLPLHDKPPVVRLITQ